MPPKIDRRRFKADVARLRKTREASGRGGVVRSGAVALIRRHFDLIERLRGEGTTWVDIAAALADQGATQGDGEPITGRRLATLFEKVRQQRQRGEKAQRARGNRGDLAAPVVPPVSVALAPELRKRPEASPKAETTSEEDLRRRRLAAVKKYTKE